MRLRIGPARGIFSRDKVIESKALNLMGAQVFRTVVARGLYSARRVQADAQVANEVAELDREGILVLPDFMDPDTFERVRAEAAWLESQSGQIETGQHGPTQVQIAVIGRCSNHLLPFTYAFYDDLRLRAIFDAAEQRPLGSLVRFGKYEHLRFGAMNGAVDPQTELHSDIFFNTHKAWLYLDDVGPEDGPLAYVRGSHRLTLPRLGFLYRESCRRNLGDEQSRRIRIDEYRRLRVEETVVTCRLNTLVVVNTCGYHRRLPGAPGRTRRSLHLSVRTNPFTRGD